MDETVMKDLPKGIELDTRISKYSYTVDPQKLILADGGFNPNSDKLEYRSIRHALSQQKLLAKGLERESMDNLTERIRTEGLHQRPICRWFKEGVQVVDGERRVRSILKLIAEDAQCWDKDAKEFIPAKKLYTKMPVYICDMDDETALKVNFSASEAAEHFSEGAVVAYVKYLRKCNLDDQTILSLIGYKPEWLHQTDKVCEAEEVFDALCQNKITRTLAINLTEIEDVNLRLEELNKRIEVVQQKWLVTQEILQTKKEKAAEKIELAKTEIHQAIAENKDQTEVTQIEEKTKKAKKSWQAAKNKLDEHEATSPKAGAKSLESKPLTYIKVEKFWLDVITEILQNDCKDGEGNDLQSEIDREDLFLAKFLCDQMRKGQRDILRILKAHKKHKVERAAKA